MVLKITLIVLKGLGSIRAIFGLIFKITLIMSNDSKELVSLKNENSFLIPSVLPWLHALKHIYHL